MYIQRVFLFQMMILINRLISRLSFTQKLLCIPIAAIGYYLEGFISCRYTPPTAPVIEQREERLLANMNSMSDEKRHSPLEVNLPPSLSM